MEGGNPMRKFLYIGIFALVMFFSTAEVRANSLENDPVSSVNIEKSGILDLDMIKITAGIMKKHEVTFDRYRNISGEADKGMVITFVVYQEGKKDNAKIYTQVVGASGLFSQLIELKEGNNYIIIVAKQYEQEKAFKFRIDCKDTTIKKELEEIKIINILDTAVDGKNALETLVK